MPALCSDLYGEDLEDAAWSGMLDQMTHCGLFQPDWFCYYSVFSQLLSNGREHKFKPHQIKSPYTLCFFCLVTRLEDFFF